MGNSKIHILCPEYVPLENKGEEAIIRGTMDVIFGKQDNPCEYHMVDMNTDEYQYVNGLHMQFLLENCFSRIGDQESLVLDFHGNKSIHLVAHC